MSLESVDKFKLPDVIRKELRLRGIKYFTPPQSRALERGLLRGIDIVVSSPTASGKTLIAEMALVRACLNGGKGVYATPLKTLANEKFEEFKLWEKYGIKVGISTGDYDEVGEWLGKYDIIVATYERLDSLFRLKPSWLRNVHTVVIDELHNISDESRGPIVELIAVHAKELGAQVVGLSATIGNPEEIAEWLGAELIVSNWRPVKLIEGFYSKRRKAIVFSDGRVERLRRRGLIEHVINHALINNYQVIIFQQARFKAERLATKVAKLLPRLNDDELIKVIKELRSSEGVPKTEAESLEPLIMHGVAFHHAGLSHGSRLAIENAFRSGVIKVVVATPTLAAGINMPARRVVVYTRRYEGGYLKPISIAEYKQMAGRAGRPQYDPYGEAIVADVSNDDEGWRYVRGEPEDVKSSLISERAMRIHVLALIASGYVSNLGDLFRFMRRTLAFKQISKDCSITDDVLRKVINNLLDMGMVIIKGSELIATKLGTMVSRLYIDPLTADLILSELRRHDKDLPPIYYLTLIAMTPDFQRVRVTKYRVLSSEARVAYDNGLIPPPIRGCDYYDWLRAYKIGLVINYWINEVSEDEIISKLGVGAGDLRNIVETCSWLIYSASKICEVCGLRHHSTQLRILSERVRYGVKDELLDLVRIKGIGRVRARILFNYGIKSLKDLALSTPDKLEKLPAFGRKLATDVIREARKLVGKEVP